MENVGKTAVFPGGYGQIWVILHGGDVDGLGSIRLNMPRTRVPNPYLPTTKSIIVTAYNNYKYIL